MFDIQRLLKSGACASVICLGASMAMAADGNQIYILQQSPLGIDSNNTLNVDQSAASGSTVAGAFGAAARTTPALQDGIDNSGNIEISGAGGQVAFLQEGIGNDATVSLSSALGMAFLQQDGNANSASLTVDPLGYSGAIQQIGSGNRGGLIVSGKGASGTLVQNGNNNAMDMTVSGIGATVSYTFNGNNMAPAGTGPVVISNGGSVTITQTQMQSR